MISRAHTGPLRWRTGGMLCLVVLATLWLVGTMMAHLPSYAIAFASMPQQPQQAISTPTLTKTTVPANQGQISKRLVRISQLDCSQYASQSECATWAYSACSTAAITEVINAYGYHYRITDMLQQEIAAKAITPRLGLVDDQGIERTAARFGFVTTWGYNLSLDQVIATADSGTPVIVGWPPAKYDRGHLVVVIGGDGNTVQLADSSRYNRQVLSRAQFLNWWAGYSAILKPGKYSFVGKPTLTASFLNRVLASYHSPAAGLGQQLYNLGVKYGIDPAYPLAFFMHESFFGTTGEARKTMSLGNERCISDRPCIDQDRGGYAQMEDWVDGFDHWYSLILNGYIYGGVTIPLAGHDCLTIQQTIPIYAPGSDGNDEAAYISALQHELQTWRSGQLRP